MFWFLRTYLVLVHHCRHKVFASFPSAECTSGFLNCRPVHEVSNNCRAPGVRQQGAPQRQNSMNSNVVRVQDVGHRYPVESFLSHIGEVTSIGGDCCERDAGCPEATSKGLQLFR